MTDGTVLVTGGSGFVAALRDPQLKVMAPLLGVVRRSTSAKAKTLLDWAPRPIEETVVDTAESLIRLGIVPA